MTEIQTNRPEYILRNDPAVGSNLPLYGKRIVLTRAVEQSVDSTKDLLENGAEIVLFPAIEFERMPVTQKVSEQVASNYYDYIIFTSANAVKYFFDQLPETVHPGRELTAKCISIGEKTSKVLATYVSNVFYVGKAGTSVEFLAELSQFDFAGKNILLPASKIARTELPDGLKALGANAELIHVYNTIEPHKEKLTEIISDIRVNGADCFIFTSPSTFANFISMMEINSPGDFFTHSLIAAIGRTTADYICSRGVSTAIVPSKPGMAELTKAIITFYQK